MTPVLLFTLAAFGLGGAGLAFASRRVDSHVRRNRFVKLATYFAVVESFEIAAVTGRIVMSGLCMAIVLAGARELKAALLNDSTPAQWIAGAMYGALAVALVAFGTEIAPARALFAFMVIATFDGFSQVAGQLAGRHPLAPGLSPAKTIEGAAGGAVAAVVAAICLRSVAGFTAPHAIAVAVAIAPAALAGDLAASAIKRRARLKDFGTILPGHGGVLDRFDSLLGAAPIALWLL